MKISKECVSECVCVWEGGGVEGVQQSAVCLEGRGGRGRSKGRVNKVLVDKEKLI